MQPLPKKTWPGKRRLEAWTDEAAQAAIDHPLPAQWPQPPRKQQKRRFRRDLRNLCLPQTRRRARQQRRALQAERLRPHSEFHYLVARLRTLVQLAKITQAGSTIRSSRPKPSTRKPAIWASPWHRATILAKPMLNGLAQNLWRAPRARGHASVSDHRTRNAQRDWKIGPSPRD